jgi:hypothetical protein
MRLPSEGILTRLACAAPAATLRACCIALLAGASACGGGDDDGSAPSSMPAPTLAPDTAQPPPAPARLVGKALPIDSPASGNPVNLRVAFSANGDGFAVWLAHDGTRHNLWANRYRAAAVAWGSPVSIEASSTDIDDFDLTVDAGGNAVVAWHEVHTGAPGAGQGMVMSARLDAGAGAWAPPVLLHANGNQPRVASNDAGAVLAVYVARAIVVRGRFFDPGSGTWQPEAAVEQNNTGTGFSSSPAVLLDGSGNALAAWRNARIAAAIVASNYFSGSAGGWGQLPPDELGPLGGVPGSFRQGPVGNVQLAASTGGNFRAAWQAAQSFEQPDNAEILTAHFTSGTRAWSTAQTLVPNTAQNIQLQRIGSDAGGNTLVLWTENSGARTALKAIRVGPDAVCTTAQVIDSAVGGGGTRADLGVDPQGRAIAIWQQFEGGRPDDGSRSNIAVNRFDGATGAWASAVFAETEPGDAISPRVSARGGQALIGWIQAEAGANRVKVLLQPLDDAPTD